MLLAIVVIVFLFFLLMDNTEALNYRWIATIDRSTGIAASSESSTAPLSSPLFEEERSPGDVFSSYPQWLCKPRISLGLLKAKKQEDGSTSLQDRLFGVELLRFDKHTTTGENTVVIPINGGILAQSDDEGNYGCLSFSIRQEGKIMETAIVDGYRPTIAGQAPVGNFRALAYRSTQSLVHAYVMWRFHGYCYAASPL